MFWYKSFLLLFNNTRYLMSLVSFPSPFSSTAQNDRLTFYDKRNHTCCDAIQYLYVSISVTGLRRKNWGALLSFVFLFSMLVLCCIPQMHIRAKALSVEAVIGKSSKVCETSLNYKASYRNMWFRCADSVSARRNAVFLAWIKDQRRTPRPRRRG